ncbi:MAG: fibronectin type III domain-containing protein, partial [Betaproteobacteria bacterium]|nr:fibronectin type III domain-containing protein [Betaproteobacteria bacterium]
NRGPVGQVATQGDGSEVMVFNFSNMRVTVSLEILGSRPAVLMSPGNIVIDAPVVVSAGGGKGAIGASTTVYRDTTPLPGPHGSSAQGATGGGGGRGEGGVCLVTYYAWGWDGAFAGGGGGGGSYSVGEAGQTGHLVACSDGRSLQYAGGSSGAARDAWTTLAGGGGGGAGGTGTNWGGWPIEGGPGGNGGGAILFATSGNLTITAQGSVRADGANAPYVCACTFEASGGGGAGGFIAFNVGGRWHSSGVVSARAGAGSWGDLFHRGATAPASPRDQMGGAGSGGYVAIDSALIVNAGAIDVSGGNLAAAPNYGGAVLLDGSTIFSTGQIEGSKNTNATAPIVASTTVPGAPNIGMATPANGAATVNFAGPDSNGGSAITGYTVTSSPGGLTESGTASPITVPGLTNGTAYTFTVTATNANGTGSASVASNSVTPSTGPGAPTIGTATPGNGSAVVTFTAPADDGGSPITSYRVTASSANAYYNPSATGTQSPITVTGLVNGQTYTFTVTATNANGTSSASAPSNSVTPATVPDAPFIYSVAPGNASASLQFSVPAANGAAIAGYAASCETGGSPVTATGSASPITVSGLTNGAAYSCTLTATNTAGTSVPSTAVTTTPRTVPGAPTIGSVTFEAGQASVSFAPPSDDGGSAITGYTVTSNPDNRVGFGTSSPITVSGLTNGVPYTFTVTASNAAGAGPASAASNSAM